jgi:hypothetical protein
MADSVDPDPALAPDDTQRKAARSRAIIWLAVIFFLTLNAGLLIRSCLRAPGNLVDATGRAIEKAGAALATVISAFKGGHVTTEFISYASSINPTHRLQFATLKQTEVFTRNDQATTGFGYIPLPEIIVEARAPVEFTYYLDLNATWRLVLEDNVIYVLAPRIQFNQPSVDVSAIKFEVRKDSVLRNTTESLEGLKQSITQLTRLKARENINLVRETGRRQTGEFVEKWLSRQFSDGRNYPVKVYFEGETLPPALQNSSTNSPPPGAGPSITIPQPQPQ